MRALPLEDIFVCYHDDKDGCTCRKPLPGLLHQAADRYCIDLSASFMVGDRWKDIEAGQSAGCTTILIDHQYTEREARRPPDCRVRLLSEAATYILNPQRSKENLL